MELITKSVTIDWNFTYLVDDDTTTIDDASPLHRSELDGMVMEAINSLPRRASLKPRSSFFSSSNSLQKQDSRISSKPSLTDISSSNTNSQPKLDQHNMSFPTPSRNLSRKFSVNLLDPALVSHEASSDLELNQNAPVNRSSSVSVINPVVRRNTGRSSLLAPVVSVTEMNEGSMADHTGLKKPLISGSVIAEEDSGLKPFSDFAHAISETKLDQGILAYKMFDRNHRASRARSSFSAEHLAIARQKSNLPAVKGKEHHKRYQRYEIEDLDKSIKDIVRLEEKQAAFESMLFGVNGVKCELNPGDVLNRGPSRYYEVLSEEFIV